MTNTSKSWKSTPSACRSPALASSRSNHSSSSRMVQGLINSRRRIPTASSFLSHININFCSSNSPTITLSSLFCARSVVKKKSDDICTKIILTMALIYFLMALLAEPSDASDGTVAVGYRVFVPIRSRSSNETVRLKEIGKCVRCNLAIVKCIFFLCLINNWLDFLRVSCYVS